MFAYLTRQSIHNIDKAVFAYKLHSVAIAIFAMCYTAVQWANDMKEPLSTGLLL
jgi:hypothetical protein